MKKMIVGFVLIIGISLNAQNNVSIPHISSINYQSENKVWFARYGQFQLKFGFTINKTPRGLPQIDNQFQWQKHLDKVGLHKDHPPIKELLLS